MDTTVDAGLIGKMIHSACESDSHHCDGCPRLRDKATPPEFLHCSRWPPSSEDQEGPSNRDGDADVSGTDVSGTEEPLAGHSRHPRLRSIVEDGTGSDFNSTCSENGSYASNPAGEDGEDGDAVVARLGRLGLGVSWQDMSEAVNSRTIDAEERDREEGGNDKENGKVNTPYSVLKLLPRLAVTGGDGDPDLLHLHQGDGKHGSGEREQQRRNRPALARKTLFDQEVAAEGQARVEITGYIDSLVDSGSYEEGYGWVWPLEDYRREGWAREMVEAYPSECVQFVEEVQARSRWRRRD